MWPSSVVRQPKPEQPEHTKSANERSNFNSHSHGGQNRHTGSAEEEEDGHMGMHTDFAYKEDPSSGSGFDRDLIK